MVKSPQVQFIDGVVKVPVMAQKQVPSVMRVQKIAELPKVRSRRHASHHTTPAENCRGIADPAR